MVDSREPVPGTSAPSPTGRPQLKPPGLPTLNRSGDEADPELRVITDDSAGQELEPEPATTRVVVRSADRNAPGAPSAPEPSLFEPAMPAPLPHSAFARPASPRPEAAETPAANGEVVTPEQDEDAPTALMQRPGLGRSAFVTEAGPDVSAAPPSQPSSSPAQWNVPREPSQQPEPSQPDVPTQLTQVAVPSQQTHADDPAAFFPPWEQAISPSRPAPAPVTPGSPANRPPNGTPPNGAPPNGTEAEDPFGLPITRNAPNGTRNAPPNNRNLRSSNGSPFDPASDAFPSQFSPSPPGNGPRTGRGRRRAFWVVAGTGVVLACGYTAAAWLLSGSAPKNTTVAGVPVGGKDSSGIVAALTDAEQKQNGRIQVALGKRTAELDVPATGLSVDPQATAARLTSFSLSPSSVWRHVAGGGAQDAVGASGQETGNGVESSLKALSDELVVPAVDATVRFTAADNAKDVKATKLAPVAPAVVGGTAGTALDLERAADAVRQGWLGGARPLKLPATQEQPAVTKAAAQKALDELAKPAVSGPLVLTVGSVKVTVQPARFAPSLSVKPDRSGNLKLAVDGDKLSAAVMSASPQLGKAPKDAVIELKDGKPHIVPGVQGVTLDPAKVGPAILPALTSKDRTASVPTKVEQPKFSTDDAKKLGVTSKISTFSTILTDNQLRTENLRVAARTVNGILVKPGETFSLNQTLGQRTPEKGYNQAPAINGGRLVQDYGGGVSQMATTIFNNVFFSGLEDIHHKPHSFYISRYPEGREATVNYPTVDLKWRNDSKYGVLIQANVTNTVNVSFWSTKVWDIQAIKGARTNPRQPGTVYDDKPGCVTQDANPGFDVSVTRVFKKNGEEVRRQTFHTTYIAEDKVVCGPKPKQKPTTDED